MVNIEPDWQTLSEVAPPPWLLEVIHDVAPNLPGHYLAQLLWQRGIHTPDQARAFLDVERYQPTSPFAFGEEMEQAIARLQQAYTERQKVAIWGDFDADGITATAVLWEGLGQFFRQHDTLTYRIPNRLFESHGLSEQGIRDLATDHYQLIVTCDTGSTNLAEIELAQSLGIDVIVTDHHTLPDERPPVVAIINPRYFNSDHPLAHLSGVAVAYKLIEALYQSWPEPPVQPVEALLDLVAIGLIADLVQLTGDCRYLAQRGIQRLQQQRQVRTRPGIARLLELCQRTGDRPTDISFGLGPRINAVSRIQGDASFCVELLTSTDEERCRTLATETELANSRRKALQNSILKQVEQQLAQVDLSTTQVIVLCDDQWPVGVLGLVAGQIAQGYGRPTILLSTDVGEGLATQTRLARGSARSVHNIDLYQLVKAQAHLLQSFGGHPFAAGLSLPAENIPLFTDAINHQLRQQGVGVRPPVLQTDLAVTVAELGQMLFRELKLVEPCGMGNPIPKLLIRNCWFERVWSRSLKDRSGQKLKYLKTEFELCDAEQHFPGHWWGHAKEDIPTGPCDAIIELDVNSYEHRYEARLVAVRSAQTETVTEPTPLADWILDWRQACPIVPEQLTAIVTNCPRSWQDLKSQLQTVRHSEQPVALAYDQAVVLLEEQWQRWVGIAKYLVRTKQWVNIEQLQDKMDFSQQTLRLGLQALEAVGFDIQLNDAQCQFNQWRPNASGHQQAQHKIDAFILAMAEEQFQQQYFHEISLNTIRSTLQNSADTQM